MFYLDKAKERGDWAVFTRELFVKTADDTYGLFGLAFKAAFFMPNFDGDAFTRPMLIPGPLLGSNPPANASLSGTVSEPTDLESWIMLLT